MEAGEYGLARGTCFIARRLEVVAVAGLLWISWCVMDGEGFRVFYWLRDLYEADFHKPGIYGRGRVWANAWDVFRRTSSRGGRGRRVAVDFVVCFGCGGILCFFSFFFLRAHTACCRYEAALPRLLLY